MTAFELQQLLNRKISLADREDRSAPDSTDRAERAGKGEAHKKEVIGSVVEEEWGISDQYFMLDSWAKLESSDISNGELSFNLALQTGTEVGVVGIEDLLEDVIEMELYSFGLPSVPLLPFITNDIADNVNGTPNIVPNTQLPRLTTNTSVPEVINTIGSAQSMACFGGVLSIGIRELDPQSTIGFQNVRYHWLCQTELSSFLTNVQVVPLLGREIFTFTKPIRDVSKMTVLIRNPDTGIMLLPDVLYGVTPRIVLNSNHDPVLEFYVPNQNHNILAGDRIFFDSIDLTNGESDPLFDVIDRWINKKSGHLVGLEGSTSIDPNFLTSGTIVPSTIRLNPDINLKDLAYINPDKYSAGTVLTSATRVNILIAKNRVQMPIRMRKVVPYRTNFKEA